MRLEPFSSHCTDFHAIRYLSISPKSFKKIQLSLKSNKNSGLLHDNQGAFMIISRTILLGVSNGLDEVGDEMK
jgi:hypothetical protein